ncbi:thermonuclease family protein [Methylobacterium sp. E-046]|uniref:thermonuclease family protein n=1 Tax=Methylobacterium sp. E-046 TaxID=2836576 RepID=UPI001FB9BB45|nr:thermonuclease family protein [Methylobacterium sp. E-046]MCJ2097462.1 thermonuclease family protein [Methylobacterium sp. E-046]
MLVWLFAFTAYAFPATVTKIADGDTFTVMESMQKIRVRIFGIDAPEHDQPYGDNATAMLAQLILGQTVEIEPPHGGRSFPKSFDRIVGVVHRNGQDVELVMIGSGNAWAYDRFRVQDVYDDAQGQAVIHGVGLWAGNPVPPWDWRKQHSHQRRH